MGMMMISVIVPFYIIGMALGAGLYGMFMLTEGFFVPRENMPVYWLWSHYIGLHTYSFRWFMFNEFDGNSFEAPTGTFNEFGTESTGRISGRSVLERYDFEDADVVADAIVLVAMAFIYRIIFYIILRKFHKGKR